MVATRIFGVRRRVEPRHIPNVDQNRHDFTNLRARATLYRKAHLTNGQRSQSANFISCKSLIGVAPRPRPGVAP
jgi:hypothetical protein